MKPTIVWYRRDLRITDHPALSAAAKRGRPIIPVYIWNPDEDDDWSPGGAGRWWLHYSLQALAENLTERKSRLILRIGRPLDVLHELIEETGAEAVYFNRDYDPSALRRDRDIVKTLAEGSIEAADFKSHLLFEPWEIANKQGDPYQVFTSYWKQCLKSAIDDTIPQTPATLPRPKSWPTSRALDELKLLPEIDWAAALRETWQPGEASARRSLKRFIDRPLADYPEQHDRPDRVGTSRLSPHLHWGEISPRQIWLSVQRAAEKNRDERFTTAANAFLRQIGWREFAFHLLHHFPHTPKQALREKFRNFPWKYNKKLLTAWQRGRTGYPLVDAGMRELWQTGWMHNRVRMVVASFLTKDLLIPWQEGARWFWDTLVDADLANNTLGWQWTAGCGADAAPYFRIFNPVSQGEKFDPDGDYIRRWVPELTDLPDRHLNDPAQAPGDILESAGVTLGQTYPHPIVDHKQARQAALDAYQIIK